MFPVGVPHQEIGRALKESEKRDEEKEQPVAETTEAKFQG